jgi:hypothetical protein
MPSLNLERIDIDFFEFTLDVNDTIFVLTKNNSVFKNNVGNIISKMIVIKELNYINLNDFSEILTGLGIKELNIFSINENYNDNIKVLPSKFNPLVQYIEVNAESFQRFINLENRNFLDYNKDSLYIIRGGNYIDIKNLFATINNHQINLGRWRVAEVSYVKSSGF